MTIPLGRYANYGPPLPPDGMPDTPPLAITHIEELPDRNGLGETIFLIDAQSFDRVRHPVKLIVRANPHSGEIVAAAVLLRPGTGFVAVATECLPGNLTDLIRTIARDPRETI